ncbi:MAG: hypothetical protein IV107_17795 [Paucibacter sp.]|nr:hypothetical protein [Roseateles sp.]
MMDMRLHEFYRKFASARYAADAEPPPIDEFAALCREAELADAASNNWLREADHCLHEIAEVRQLFVTAISKWLTQDGSKTLAKALVHKVSVRHLQQAFPESYDLSAITEDQGILTGFRLCALAATPAVSLGWVLSLASLPSKSAAITAAVERLLKHLVEEQPSTTMRLLSSKESVFKDLEIAKEALTYLKAEDDWLDQQPRLRELVMTPEMRLVLSSMKRNESREIHRHSQEKSVLATLFKAQHFKYANRTAVEFLVGDEVKETMLEMSPFSVSVELPFSEQVDPVAGKVVRDRLWRGASQ